MRCVRLHPEGLSVDSVPIPEPGAGEVLLEVRACGLNRIDLLTRDGLVTADVPLPHILGSEVSGVVSAAGPDVPTTLIGSRVVVDPVINCGHCELCRRGRGNICPRSRIFGVQTDGGYAEYVVVPSAQLIHLPPLVDFEAAAAVTAAGATALHMLRSRAVVQPGDTVLVLAAGSGVGSVAIQIARNFGARVIATAGSEEKRRHATELGADAVVDHYGVDWWREVRALTDGKGVDVVVEHVGAATWQDSVRSMGRGGTLVTCGGHSGFKVDLDLWGLFVKEQSILGSFSTTRLDVVDALAMVAEGTIRPVIHALLPLEDAAAGLALLDDGAAFGKVILTPAGGARPRAPMRGDLTPMPISAENKAAPA